MQFFGWVLWFLTSVRDDSTLRVGFEGWLPVRNSSYCSSVSGPVTAFVLVTIGLHRLPVCSIIVIIEDSTYGFGYSVTYEKLPSAHILSHTIIQERACDDDEPFHHIHTRHLQLLPKAAHPHASRLTLLKMFVRDIHYRVGPLAQGLSEYTAPL
jgi:hypothetical protein